LAELDIKRKATELLEKGRYDDAVAEYKAFLDSSRKKNPAVLNLIGDIYAKQGNFEHAFEHFLEAARLYSEEGLYHNGIAVGKKVLRMDREQTEVYGMLGILYARQGLGGDCVKFLREFARRKDGEGEYPVALASFAEACEILKQFPEVHVEYGEMLERVDRHDDAAACYRTAARLWGDRGIVDRAAEWNRRAAQLTGGAPPDDVANMKEIMSLRTLDDSTAKIAPADASRSRFWGRDDQPQGLGLDETIILPRPPLETARPPGAPAKPRAFDHGGPWVRFDPRAHPSLPPPPPLPPRGRSKAPAAEPDTLFAEPKGLHGASADPNTLFIEPRGLRGPSGELVLDVGAVEKLEKEPRPAPGPPPVAETVEGLERSPSAFGAPSPAAEADAGLDLSQLPGIVMPHAAAPPAPAPPAPTAAAPPAAPPAREPAGAAPPSAMDQELAAFFEESTASPAAAEQAVVIGDDFELVREGGDVSEVIADFRAATLEILDLDDHQAHYDLGTTFMEMELFDEAAAEFEIAARGSDFALASQEMLGYCFLRKGQIELAIRELEKGLAIPVHDDRAKLGLLYNLGIACGVLDRDQDAITHFQRILEVDPNFRDTQTRLERLVQSSS
jgi:tetratricopeptide (TPR) repeat protein